MTSPFEIKSLKGDNVLWNNHFEPVKSGIYLPACTHLGCSGGWGKMDFQFIQKPTFSIWHSHYAINRRNEFTARSKDFLLEFSLQMNQPVSYRATPFNHQTIKSCQFNLFFLPYMESKAVFEAGSTTTTLDIHFSIDYLSKLSEGFPDIVLPLLNAVTTKRAVSIFSEPLYATGFMLYAARNIINLLRKNPSNDYLLELNVHTLLCYALTCKYELNSKTKKISLEQISHVYAIRNRLEADFSKVPNLAQLAKEACMSLSAFKVVFKKEFQVSPYHHWLTSRMNEAYLRLEQTSDTVSQIAFDLAFPDVSNFSKAFKKYFGFPPTDLR